METSRQRPKTLENCRLDFMERGKNITGCVVYMSFVCARIGSFGECLLSERQLKEIHVM